MLSYLLQVGFKAMAYVMLHGEATLDLLEIAPRELQFRQVQRLSQDRNASMNVQMMCACVASAELVNARVAACILLIIS